ncbi:MAG: 5-(carboxyamino)imidazole ribonucleotide mutase [Fimbriimonadales bacterium]|nr:MAG: 5-(carboxyamino)imidazole ribonucleotide mutase [Fimbriimonadales bacterium]
MVGIIMGSDSDLPVMEQAEAVLKEFGVPYELDVMSAHRTPDRVREWVSTARDRGLKVIIAGAGMSAHLAGVVAAHTTLPVIGVPLASGALNGVDALYSTVNMPPGVPVATVAVDGARNAGILAVQILATSDASLAAKLEDFKKEMAAKVEERSKKHRRSTL